MLLAALVAIQLMPDSVPMTAADPAGHACESVASAFAPREVARDVTTALRAHGGAVRWDATRPVSVWLQKRPGGGTDFPAAVWRRALAGGVTDWAGVVPDLRLTIAGDSASADVRVVWAASLPTSPNDPSAGALASLTAGRTTLVPTDDGRVAAATVWIAATAGNGVPYQPGDVRAVMRHEFGHALGLGHHADPASVMAPLVVAEAVGAHDRAVARAYYALPAGIACR